jgi:hypothetical protein
MPTAPELVDCVALSRVHSGAWSAATGNTSTTEPILRYLIPESLFMCGPSQLLTIDERDQLGWRRSR